MKQIELEARRLKLFLGGYIPKFARKIIQESARKAKEKVRNEIIAKEKEKIKQMNYTLTYNKIPDNIPYEKEPIVGSRAWRKQQNKRY